MSTNYDRIGIVVVAIFAPLLWLQACDSDVEIVGGGSTTGAGASSGSGTSSSGGRGGYDSGGGSGYGGQLQLDASTEFYDGPEYDGDQSCAPEKAESHQVVSCCEGEPCHGDCEWHGDQWICVCSGIAGGCGQYDMLCCFGGCTAPGGCDYGI